MGEAAAGHWAPNVPDELAYGRGGRRGREFPIAEDRVWPRRFRFPLHKRDAALPSILAGRMPEHMDEHPVARPRLIRPRPRPEQCFFYNEIARAILFDLPHEDCGFTECTVKSIETPKLRFDFSEDFRGRPPHIRATSAATDERKHRR